MITTLHLPSQDADLARTLQPADPLAARSCAPAMRRPGQFHDLPRNSVLLRRLRSNRVQRYYLFVPASYAPGREIVVLVHGISRNAREHAIAFAPFAARSGVALLAPLFTKEFCRDYQRLGLTGTGHRADALLQDIVAEATSDIGAIGGSFSLFGHSGGAQFAHRYAFAWPQHVRRLAVCAAGNYTFPDPSLPFPFGLDCSGLRDHFRFELHATLRIPTLVVVGSRDRQRDQTLRSDSGLDELQGRHRFERGRRWTRAMIAAAAAHGIASHIEFVRIPGAGHRFTDTVRRGLCEAVWPWLTANLEHTSPAACHISPHDETIP